MTPIEWHREKDKLVKKKEKLHKKMMKAHRAGHHNRYEQLMVMRTAAGDDITKHNYLRPGRNNDDAN